MTGTIPNNKGRRHGAPHAGHGPDHRQLQAVAAAGETAGLMRVAWNDPVLIKRALIWAWPALWCRRWKTPSRRRPVTVCHYPPKDIRGCATRVVRAGDITLLRDAARAQVAAHRPE